jgi:nucleoside-diphosphate-sugar epimerase
MPALGALPARFRRPRLLIIGCGDVGVRAIKRIPKRGAGPAWAVMALTSTPIRCPDLRALGVRPLVGNLDEPASLLRLAGLATHVLHLAPPATVGVVDQRTRGLLRALRRRGELRQVVYGSTTGVYGDCQGARVSETDAVNPQTDRARRRVDAEATIASRGRAVPTPFTILRIPGIYAPDRENGTPEARLQRGTPIPDPAHDVFTNHIHADDLANACWQALQGRARHQVVNVNDDSEMRMGDYISYAASVYGLPVPPRLPLEALKAALTPMALSFMQESRRIDNTRMKIRLGVRLRYPTVREGLTQRPQPSAASGR